MATVELQLDATGWVEVQTWECWVAGKAIRVTALDALSAQHEASRRTGVPAHMIVAIPQRGEVSPGGV